jgi:hypothetical protein
VGDCVTDRKGVGAKITPAPAVAQGPHR